MRGGRSVSTIFEADGVPHFTADVDAWLSAVMGCRVNRISRAAAPDATGAAAWAEALAAPGFSYAKLPCQAVVAAQRLEDATGRVMSRPQRMRGRYYSFMPSVLKAQCERRFDAYCENLP